MLGQKILHGQNMVVTNLVPRLQNCMYLKSEQMKLTDFLLARKNSNKFKDAWKFLEWAWSKMGVVSLMMGSRIDFIRRMNWWNKLISCMLLQIHAKIKIDQNFLVGKVQNGFCQSGHGTLKLAVSHKWIDGTDSGKLKANSMFFEWARSKMARVF